MTTSYGAAGAYGILLTDALIGFELMVEISEVATDLAKGCWPRRWLAPTAMELTPEVLRVLHRADLAPTKELTGPSRSDVDAYLSAFYDSDVRMAVRRCGIPVPGEARLFYTGLNEDRPGRCDTDSEQLILGFGLMAAFDAGVNADLPPGFRQQAKLHTWVWASG